MTCWILAVGKCKGLVESLLWAASAGVIQADAWKILWLDGAQENLQVLQKYTAAYQQVREILPADAVWQGFRASIEILPWQTENAKSVVADNQEDALLWQALTVGCDASALERKRKTVAFAQVLQNLPENSPFKIWLDGIKEGSQVLLCGHSGDETASARLPLLAQYLRDTLGEKARIGALMLLPETKDEVQSTEALLSREDWLEGSTLNASYLLGMPEDAWRETAEGESLLDWLAMKCIAHFFDGGEDGCFTYRTADAQFTWQTFQEPSYRKNYGALWRLNLLAEGTMDTMVTAALAGKNVLQARGMGCDAACYRYVKKLLTEASGAAQWQAVMTCLRGVDAWMRRMLNAIPVTMQSENVQNHMRQEAAENYRELLEAYGQWVMMQEEIERSGMDTESTVRRGEIQENEADEAIRLAKEQHDEVLRLEGNQRVLDRRTGGMAKMRLMEQMADGIAHAIEVEQARVVQDREALEEEDDLSLRHSVRRLENHLRLLQAQWKRVTEDQDAAEEAQIDRLPPVLPENAEDAGALIDRGARMLASNLAQCTDVRAHKAKWAEAAEMLPTAVRGATCRTSQEILRSLGEKRNTTATQGETSAVGVLLMQLLDAVGEVES